MAKPLRKKYRSFNSLKSLEDAQNRIKREYRDIEENAISNIFDPVKIGISFLPSVFSFLSSRKSKHKKSKKTGLNRISLQPVNARPPINAAKEYSIGPENMGQKKSFNILNVYKNKGFGRKVLASLIRWQLLELSIWGIRKIVKKKKKKQ